MKGGKFMKLQNYTITARQLAENYVTLNPSEFQGRAINWLDLEHTFGNWLENPRLALSNWCGKVTRAFFIAHNVTPPKRLSDVKNQFVALCGQPEPDGHYQIAAMRLDKAIEADKERSGK